MDFETYAMAGPRKRGLATKPSSMSYEEMSLDDRVAYCGGKLLDAAAAFHKLHLKVNGQGAYAAHKALGDLYEQLPGLTDAVLEGYQGAAEVILDFEEENYAKTLNSVEDAVSYIRELSGKVSMLQQMMPYTEVVNDLDNIKSLFNSTKYKLLFLK
jgi:DNA-binding ferritin-like protein